MGDADVSSPISVGVSRQSVLLFGFFFAALGAASIWFGGFEGWRNSGPGRAVGLIPFGPPILMIVMLVQSVAGLALVSRIRPPKPLLWIENDTILAEGFWGRRSCRLSDISNVAALKRMNATNLVVSQVNGRGFRVGFSPEGTTWPDVAQRVDEAISHAAPTGH